MIAKKVFLAVERQIGDVRAMVIIPEFYRERLRYCGSFGVQMNPRKAVSGGLRADGTPWIVFRSRPACYLRDVFKAEWYKDGKALSDGVEYENKTSAETVAAFHS